jgi:hypothetical protein
MESSTISKVSKAESFNKSTKALSKSKVGEVIVLIFFFTKYNYIFL